MGCENHQNFISHLNRLLNGLGVQSTMTEVGFPDLKTFVKEALLRGACGVMVIVVGNGHAGTSSIPGRDWLHFP